LCVEDKGYTGGTEDKGTKDPVRAAAEARTRRLIDRGAESMLKDLGLKLQVFRRRVPWVRERRDGRGPARIVPRNVPAATRNRPHSTPRQPTTKKKTPR
ncbi:MAG TPA: hypothetical protein VFV05_11840, partial [Methylomirabilota bacterium]|nr:hypothetical protein [Methylomirabilota bacterium]